MYSNQRHPTESFQDYKERLRRQSKEKPQTRLLWNSDKRGTYRRKFHGELK